MTEEDVASYGDAALEQLIQSVVLQDKVKELGFDPLGEEDAAEVAEYADSMMEFYKLMMRYQNYPDLETVEEEQERLTAEAEETPSEPVETVATLTNADLDALLESDLSAQGITREYFVQSRTSSVQSDKLYEYVTADVTVTDEQVKAEFDSKVASQKESYDATPTLYASNSASAYYVPEGYRGVKNLLIKISDEDQSAIDELNDTFTTAKNTLNDVNGQLEDLRAEDTSAYDEETLASYNGQIAALEEQAAAAQATIDETSAAVEEKTEAAFAAILPKAQEVLALAQSGEDFDALVETYGEDIPVEYLADAFWHTYRLRGLFPSKHGLRRVFFWLVEPLFGVRGFITGHVSPRQLDKRLPDDWTDPFTGEHHDGGLFALLPKAVFRSEQFMEAALLYWMNRLPPAEFAEKLGGMSYLQGIATPESDPDTTNQTEKENTV